MTDKQIAGDLAVFTLGGSSQLAVLEQVTYGVAEYETEDGSSIKQTGRVVQMGQRGGTIECTEMSTISDGVRVTSLETSAFSIGGTDFLADLNNLRFSIENETKNATVIDPWKWFQYMGKRDYMADVDLLLPVLAGVALDTAFHSSSRTAVHLVLSLTLNGVVITLPMGFHKAVHKFDNGDFQMWTCSAKGRCPDNLATAYPTAPTGTTSLLEKALNAPGTALAGVLTSHATEGGAKAGNLIIKSANFSVGQTLVVKTGYTFENQGAWTYTPN